MKNLHPYITASTILVAATALLLWPHDAARPDEERYKAGGRAHENVYKHRNLRNILSFKEILKLVRPHISGEIIEAEFEFEDGIPAYEFKYIDRSGRVTEIYVDARNGKILKQEEDD